MDVKPPNPLQGWDASRVHGALLGLANRRRIVDHVEDNPGIHLRRVARDLGLALGTAEHHLHLLVQHGVLARQEVHGQACYFVAGRLAPEDARLLAVLRHDAPRRLLRALAADGGLDCAALAFRMGVTPAAVAYHLQRLAALGLVERLRVGRATLLRVARPDALAAALQILDSGRPPLAWPGFAIDGAPAAGAVDVADRLGTKDRPPAPQWLSEAAADGARTAEADRSSSP